jgi:predicted dehydrogenase
VNTANHPRARLGPKSPLRVAFVGAGHMARLHLHALRRVCTPHTVVGVYDVNDNAGRQLAALADARSFHTLEELFAEARPHLVHICSSAGTHFEPARQALLAGAHVYVEKPFVETAPEARELLALAAKQELLVCAGHQQVRAPAYVALLRRGWGRASSPRSSWTSCPTPSPR